MSVHDLRFKCSICDDTFKKPLELQLHVSKKHEGKEPFNCSICNVTFLYKEDLKKHACVLQDDKPFKYPECDVGFAKKAELKRQY